MKTHHEVEELEVSVRHLIVVHVVWFGALRADELTDVLLPDADVKVLHQTRHAQLALAETQRTDLQE